MKERKLPLAVFEKYKDYGAVFLRLLIGIFVIYGVLDNVFSSEHMHEFAVFLSDRGVPLPSLAAHISAYTQLVCGLSILLGAFIRIAAVPFIINFVAAIIIAHLGDTFRGMFPPLMMIAAGYGAGKRSVDQILAPDPSG